MIKKGGYHECGGDCDNCSLFGAKEKEMQMVLVKKKVSKKYVPPDMSALKLILEKEEGQKNIETMTDEELMQFEKELAEKFLRMRKLI